MKLERRQRDARLTAMRDPSNPSVRHSSSSGGAHVV
jgi:hypothetical protein